MTEKSQKILNRMRERDRKRGILARLSDPKHRNHLVGDINLLDQDETSRVGSSDQELKILKEMNELQEFENNNWSKGSV